MKIGITIPYASVNYCGGLNVQCRMWQQGLNSLGHEVYLLNPWDKFEYNEFDYLIIVGLGELMYNYVRLFKQFEKPKIICAPVLDPHKMSIRKFRFKCKYIGCSKINYYTIYHNLYLCRNDFFLFLVRSEYEKSYFVKGLGIPESKVKIVPISMRFEVKPTFDLIAKEDICLHVSRLASRSKNVYRLIEAAKKYNFKLALVGTLNGEKEQQWLDGLIKGCDNIKYLGWLNDEELALAYQKAKVFALPSIVEGVGMVALEAASYGCEICLTNIGGPKEYYDGRAVLVDPYDIDSIGNGVLEAMTGKKAQPELSNYILSHYSVEHCMQLLESFLKEA